MGSNHNVYQPAFQVLDRISLLGHSPESAHQIYPDREILHPLAKCVVMLLCQNGSRYQIDHLLIFLYCLKCRTDCNFCLSITYITTDQTIHDLVAFHILLHSIDRQKLIFCLLIREHFLKFFLPDCILPVNKPILILSCCIKFYQIFCNFFNCPPDLCLRLSPLLGSKTVKFWLFGIRTGIFLDQIQLCCRNIKISALSIRNLHIVFGNLIHFDFFNSLINSQSMILMYHIISRF